MGQQLGIAMAVLTPFFLSACTSPAARSASEVRADAGGPVEKPGAAVAANPALPGLEAEAALVERLVGALRAQGTGYRARTAHLNPDGSPRFVNRLILQTSPHLLQHAHNPVSWYAWSDEPFERARLEGKPVLLSIGYSTCHWC